MCAQPPCHAALRPHPTRHRCTTARFSPLLTLLTARCSPPLTARRARAPVIFLLFVKLAVSIMRKTHEEWAPPDLT
jgi:hypothetical protein